MSITAFKKTNENLQKLLDFLGKNGGYITTKAPNQWWKLVLYPSDIGKLLREVTVPGGQLNYVAEENNPNIHTYLLGICQDCNGDALLYDPVFGIQVVICDNDKITETKIIGYRSDTVLGSFWIDDGNYIYSSSHMHEKLTYGDGLRRRFDSFLYNITHGPYLIDPAKVVKYDA